MLSKLKKILNKKMKYHKKLNSIFLLSILLPNVVYCLPKLSSSSNSLLIKPKKLDIKSPLSSSSWSSPKLKSYDIWGTGAIELKNQNKTFNSKLDDATVVINSSVFSSNRNNQRIQNTTRSRTSKVLNFFPVGNDGECLSGDGRRSGVCLNAYECRIQGGASSGQCALGFGVCCVFTATCDQEVFNNITYIVSPNFPALMPLDVSSCKLKIRMINPDISQLRLDFQHFSLGQPNRRTGVCDGDALKLTGGLIKDFTLCGQNSGQHIYYDVSGKSREDGIELAINMASRYFTQRFWEIRVLQMPFGQRAPSGCLQYFAGASGVIQTFNFAENGRHLANQDYRACVRQESGMCSISYEPCDDQSFRIGLPGSDSNQVGAGYPNFSNMPGFGGPSYGMPLNGQQGAPGTLNAAEGALADPAPAQAPAQSAASQATQDESTVQNDEVEGSGGGAAPVLSDAPGGIPVAASSGPLPEDDGIFGFRLPSFPSFPSFFSTRNYFGFRSKRKSRQFFPTCSDRITLPCIVEDFIGAGMGNVPGCEPIHCGNTLCASGQNPCRIETSVTPFGLGIHFGDGIDKGSPEDNIGACLRYNQVACL